MRRCRHLAVETMLTYQVTGDEHTPWDLFASHRQSVFANLTEPTSNRFLQALKARLPILADLKLVHYVSRQPWGDRVGDVSCVCSAGLQVNFQRRNHLLGSTHDALKPRTRAISLTKLLRAASWSQRNHQSFMASQSLKRTTSTQQQLPSSGRMC